MITKNNVLDLILFASPSFQEIANKELSSKKESYWYYEDNGEMLIYTILGDFA